MEPEFETDDLVLATLLLGQGHVGRMTSVDGPEPGDPPVCVWFFPQSDQLLEFLVRYTSGEIQVEPLSFYTSLHEVRVGMFAFLKRRPSGTGKRRRGSRN